MARRWRLRPLTSTLSAWFNAVAETNVEAVALYRSLGFSIVGTVPEAFDHPEHGLVGLHVMHLKLR
jgi:ribosomal protein S18 acetylase RimI-like enzyme